LINNHKPFVIVLILSYNGKHLLEDSISSYLANDYPNFEIVVIDNGSTDGTKEWVAKNYPDVFVLRTENNLGYSGGFNFGLDYAFNKKNADYVLITNNDVKADSKVISELVKVAETDPMIGFVTGKVYYYDMPDTLQTVGYNTDPIMWVKGHKGQKQKDVGQFDTIEELELSDDIFMLVTNNLYNAVGGYNTEFKFQGEQMDWQIRAKKIGFKIFYTPSAKIWHKESMTIGKSSPFKTYYDVRNTLIIVIMHRDKEFIKKYHKWYIRSIIVKPIIKSAIKLKFNYTLAILKGYFSALNWAKRNKKLSLIF